MEPDPTRPPAVLFGLCCGTAAQASPEAFANFHLKNGWNVKSIERIYENKTHGDWQPLSWPTIGSDRPYIRIKLNLSPPGGFVYVAFRITIEGRENTDPYN